MTTATITRVQDRYENESAWIAAARALIPAGGKMQTNRGYGSGQMPVGPSISVYDADGHEVARVTWERC